MYTHLSQCKSEVQKANRKVFAVGGLLSDSRYKESPLEEKMATHFSILAWKTPWTGKRGSLQSMGLQRVGHNLVTKQQHSDH